MAITLFAASVLLALGLAVTDAGAEVTVYRGGAVETIDTDRTEPVILRGGGSLRDRVAAPDTTPRSTRLAAGDTLWLIDGDGWAITACSLRSTAYAGKRRIICTHRH